MGNPLFAKKPLGLLTKEAQESGEHTLRRRHRMTTFMHPDVFAVLVADGNGHVVTAERRKD